MTSIPARLAVDWTLPPADVIDVLQRTARRIETPCGAGAMVWRLWGAGPPLVLLHGGFGSWTHWIRNIPALAARYTVVAADLPGLGDSADAPQPHTVENLGEILAAGVQAVVPPPTPFRIVGFSFGSVLGGHLAVANGERVRAFIGVGASALGLRRQAVEGLNLEQPGMTDAEIDAMHRRNLEILMMADPAHIDPLAIYVHRRNLARARVRSRRISMSDSLARMLPQIRGCLMGIWGERDVTAFGHIAPRRALFESIQPGCPFVAIPGAGHWVMYEAAEAFNAALLGMLAAVDRPA
jgi:2-hydroxy-6-oxonona-2,4-dienedioate hydrolase